MSLNAAGVASSAADAYFNIVENQENAPPSVDFLTLLVPLIDDGFQAAVPSMLNVDITTAAGTLSFPSVPDPNATTYAMDIGQACADYWAINVAKTGTPQNLCTSVPSAIVGVENTANTIASIIADGLALIATPARAQTPYFEAFVGVIFDAVKTITWTVDEAGTNTGSPDTPCEITYSGITVS